MYKRAIEIWFKFYKEKTCQDYIMDGVQGRHLKLLLKKVETKLKQKEMEVTDDNILNSLSGLLNHITDQWILENLDISIVNSKFNSIYAKAIANNPFNAKSRIDDLIEHKFGTGRAEG